jgi:glutamyl-tRNA reductase
MNHKTAPLELRERLCFTPPNQMLKTILALPEAREAYCLATCNRVELLAVFNDDYDGAGIMVNLFERAGNFSLADCPQSIYLYRNEAAVLHLFRVAASLDSLVMGEAQILGQVKEAYREAAGMKATGLILNKLLHQTFKIAKRVRTETAVGENALSVSSAAVTLAKKIFGRLTDKHALLVGAGEMAELAARQLMKYGVRQVTFINRTHSRAEALAREFGGLATGWENLPQAMTQADIVITSTGATTQIISYNLLERVMRERKGRPMFLIDIAVPRDIDPEAGELENVFLYNIDDLEDVIDENRQKRQEEALKAQGIITAEVTKFLAWQHTLKVVPTINALRLKFEAVAAEELQRHSHWLAALNEDDRKQVELILISFLNKLLHDPVTSLKEESGHKGTCGNAEAISRLFRLTDKKNKDSRCLKL